MILNKAQAQAVYNAMAELNNVGGLINVTLEQSGPLNFKRVFEYDNPSGVVKVVHCVAGHLGDEEIYASQVDFSLAYEVS
jgi:hypothetical protein